jgi:hypothetical protein
MPQNAAWRWIWLAGVVLAIAVPALAGCGASTGASPLATPSAAEASAAPSADLLAEVQQDLGQRLSVEAADIETVSVEPVEWPDSSLGCPEPGSAYTQGIEPGYRITLYAEGRTYTYHTGERRFLLCKQPDPTREPAYGPALQSVLDEATADLGAQLGVQPDAIKVQSIEEQMWSDSSLGCPQPGMAYLPAITPGYQIVLAVDRREYRYHTSHDRVVQCQRAPGEVRAPPEAQDLVDRAREDLAERIDVAPDRARLIQVEAVEWPDGSLGCPEPGKGYITMIIPGYRIVFEVDGERYEYHASQSDVIWCENPPNR